LRETSPETETGREHEERRRENGREKLKPKKPEEANHAAESAAAGQAQLEARNVANQTVSEYRLAGWFGSHCAVILHIARLLVLVNIFTLRGYPEYDVLVPEADDTE
jgi:hypothetical protein